jgi:hypothetical protein
LLIEKSYKVLIVTPESTVLDEINLKDYDLHKPLAASDLADQIENTILAEEARLKAE